ncbi:cation transporter [Providencia rettgeri]|uniref:Copper-binding protein n=2 Tax=Providencia TaxID=586 RepID=A0AA42FRF3_9GAMM|nr:MULTISPECIES: copper-binding protein [Providencia]MBC8654496.1 copper-binding protein [Providencia vermicola]HCI97932.1 cation transporter [Providencia sp.]APC10370.1 Cation efflux system protein CusF precursor [Providencia rettgeri]AVL73995.1 cation transporter [Providencia rettgeri]EIL1982181.1 copper-binding protein [Providencia rettgeri]
MKNLNKVIFALSIGMFTTIGYANTAEHDHSVYPEKVAEPVINTEGKLIAIDKANKKLTINHQAIESIGWPPMTMRFTYEDENMIKGLQENDELTFSFSQKGNLSILKSIEKIN